MTGAPAAVVRVSLFIVILLVGEGDWGLRAGDQYTDAKPEGAADESPFPAQDAQDCPSHSALIRLHRTWLWPTTCLGANSGPVQQGDRTGFQTPIEVNVSCSVS